MLNRTHSLVRQTTCIVFFRKLNSNVKYKLFLSYCTSYYGCELYGLTPRVISLTSVLCGVRCPCNLEFTVYHTQLFAAYYFLVPIYLYLTNSVAVQSTLRAHAYRISHNSSVRLRCIVYTLHAVIHQWV